MTINLSEIEFDNDFFMTTTPNGDELILNKMDESLKIDSEEETVLNIKNINIELVKTDNTYVKCPCVIGMGDEYIHIDTDYKDLEGVVLTSENMKYCTINIYG